MKLRLELDKLWPVKSIPRKVQCFHPVTSLLSNSWVRRVGCFRCCEWRNIYNQLRRLNEFWKVSKTGRSHGSVQTTILERSGVMRISLFAMFLTMARMGKATQLCHGIRSWSMFIHLTIMQYTYFTYFITIVIQSESKKYSSHEPTLLPKWTTTTGSYFLQPWRNIPRNWFRSLAVVSPLIPVCTFDHGTYGKPYHVFNHSPCHKCTTSPNFSYFERF